MRLGLEGILDVDLREFSMGFVIPNRPVIFGTPDDPISLDILDNPDFSSGPVIPNTWIISAIAVNFNSMFPGDPDIFCSLVISENLYCRRIDLIFLTNC